MLLSPSVVFLLSSFLCHLLPSSSVIFPPPVLRRLSRLPDLPTPRNRGRGTRRVRLFEKTPNVPGGEVSGTNKIPGEPSLNYKNRGKEGALPLSFGPKNQKGRDVIAFENLGTPGPRFPGPGGKKRVRGGKPELSPDPGRSCPPIPRTPRVLNLPISRPPGDSSTSGPNIRQM